MLQTLFLVLVAIAVVTPLALGFIVMGGLMLATFFGSFVAMFRSVFEEKWIRARDQQSNLPVKPAWV